MVTHERILFLVTARGGSKGIPKKNIAKIAEIHLIGFKIISAKKSIYYDNNIIISTDSYEIADIARNVYGASVPFLRPARLATDTASSIDVIIHAINTLEKDFDRKFDIIVLLEPSSPFATYIDIDNSINMLLDKKGDSVVGVRKSISANFITRIDEDGKLVDIYEKLRKIKNMTRQNFNECTPNGAVYAAYIHSLMKYRSFYSPNVYGYFMKDEYSLEIDEPFDLDFAQFLIEKGHVNLDFWK